MSKKKLYKIGHLTKILDVTPRTIRYYDQMGLLPHVKRSDGKMRLFDDEDIAIIQKIRHMKKNEYLPLDVIKSRLFGTPGKGVMDVAIVTDSSACLPADHLATFNIHMLDLSVCYGGKKYSDNKPGNTVLFSEKANGNKEFSLKPPSANELADLYLSLSKQGYKEIFSVHASNFSPNIVNQVKVAALQVDSSIKVNVIEIRSIGPGVGLMATLLAGAAQEKSSIKEIRLLADKNTSLVSDIVTTSPISFFFQNKEGLIYEDEDISYNSGYLKEKTSYLRPIFTLEPKTGHLNLEECCLNKASAIETMITFFEKERLLRGGYVRQVIVGYGEKYGDAIELVNKIKLQNFNIPISLYKVSLSVSSFIGPDALTLSFI